jgi:anti-anti-sigma factor
MDNGRVLHASQNNVHVLRFIGDIRYPISPSIARYIDEIFSGPAPAGFVIDLTETDGIDSTNLGLLVRVARRMQELGDQRITIVSNRADINSVLFSMSLDEVFDIVENDHLAAGPGERISHETADRKNLQRTLIDAHHALMDLSKENRGMFKDVVASLEKSRNATNQS